MVRIKEYLHEVFWQKNNNIDKIKKEFDSYVTRSVPIQEIVEEYFALKRSFRVSQTDKVRAKRMLDDIMKIRVITTGQALRFFKKNIEFLADDKRLEETWRMYERIAKQID